MNTMSTKNKPKIYKQSKWWACKCPERTGIGADIITAYNNWARKFYVLKQN